MRSTQSLDPAHIKRYNVESLLSTLVRCQPVSRAELSRLTEMSSDSVTRYADALIALGLVRQVDAGKGQDQNAVNLETVPEGMFTLGCHFDTHSLRVCLMDFSNSIRAVSETVIGPDDFQPKRLAAIAKEQAARMQPNVPDRLRSVGVSVSGRLDLRNERVAASDAFGWTNVDLVSPFSEALGVPVVLENDVRACLTWESMRLKQHDSGQNCAYLYLGRTGIGFASIVGGQLVRGFTNSAGEIENVRLNVNDHLNEHLMEVSLIKWARCFSPTINSIGDILKAYRMGLSWARLLMDDFVGHLNVVLQLVQAILDPDSVILGGDITESLRHSPGLLPEGQYSFGEQFEDSCARGAAVIAMQKALHDRIRDAMESDSGGSDEE